MYIIKNFHNEAKEITTNKEFEYLFETKENKNLMK